jgi:serine/threonine protein kinase
MPDAHVSPQDPQKPLVAETVPSPVGGAVSPFDAPERLDPPAAGRYAAHTFHMPGGMGRVWRATDSELGRDVALKEIRPKYANDVTARRRFEFEVEVTGRLEHPAIIPVYGYGWDAEGRPFYAMRFVEGQTLHDCLSAFHAREWPNAGARQLELRRLLNHFVTVCRAVAYAHSRGVIHRDLKPANVMLGAFGETFVLDWGIAKRLRTAPGEAAEAPLDGEDEVAPGKSRRAAGTNQIGTPEYWAPEQLAGAPELHDERTDVYGLGAILYAVLTGSSPHPLGVHSPEPRSARAVRPWVDAGLDAVVTQALALEREGRFQRADEVAAAVEEWLADQPLVAQRGLVAALAAEAATNPTDRALNEQLARQRMNLGLMLSGTGRDEPAATEFRACATALARLYTDAREPRLLADRAAALLAEAQSLSALERTDEAVKAGRDAALLYKELAERDPQQVRTIKVTLSATHSQLDLELPPSALPPEAHPLPSVHAFDFVVPEGTDTFSEIEPPALPSTSDVEKGTASPLPPRPNAGGSKSSFEFTLSSADFELPPEPSAELTSPQRDSEDAPVPASLDSVIELPPVPATGSVPDIALLFPPASKGDSVPDLADLLDLDARPPAPPPEPPPPQK